MIAKPIRLAHLVSHPIQYFAPLYRELATRPEIDLTVYFYSDATAGEFHDAGFGRSVVWDTPLLGGYEHRFLPSARRTGISGGFLKRPNIDIVQAIARERYDAMWVHGYAHMTTWLAAAAAQARGTKVLIRDDQTLLHGRPAHRQALKTVALRSLYARAYGLYPGQQSRRYFRRYGMAPERLYRARYSVDNAYFRARATELALRRAEVRAAFGITNDAPVVLFCGKLIDKKQPLALLEAFGRVRADQPCWLLIAGDGELRGAAEATITRHNVPNVKLAGFLNQSQLPEAYAAADMLVLPSKLHETWGHVVNEAMNFGLPIVVSDKVGCANELVEHGGNGFIVPHNNVSALADAIAALVRDPEQRAAFGARSRAIIEQCGPEQSADDIVAACLAATGRAVTVPALLAA